MVIENVLNTVIHGDCLEMMKQMPDESIDLIVTSPPYNLRTKGMQGKIKNDRLLWKSCALRGGYDGYEDNMPHEKYIEWQKQCVAEMFRLIKPSGAIFYNNKNRFENSLLVDVGCIVRDFPIRQIIIWNRKCGMNFNQKWFLPVTEQIYIICKNDFKLVKGAGKFTDVWDFMPEMNNPHPAPFPVELTDRIIQSTDAQIILDPFGGSGTTAISAIKAGRNFILIDQSEKYCEMARKRIADEDWREKEPEYVCKLF